MRWFVLPALAAFTCFAFAPPAKKKPVASKTTAKRSVKGRSRSKKPAGPSYQLHPDPERYTQIQKALAERGYFKGEPNGEWKDDSVDAMRRFQTDQKLADDGKITSLSLSALGLGPRHDGTTASTVPVAPPPPAAQEPAAPPPNL